MITLLLSQYDLNNVEKDIKHQIITIIINIFVYDYFLLWIKSIILFLLILDIWASVQKNLQ